MVGNQTTNLTLGLSFCHNLCCKCLNGPCKAIFDIYTLIDFQWYKEHPNAMCFDPYNRTLKFLECEFHPHTPSKQGCHISCLLIGWIIIFYLIWYNIIQLVSSNWLMDVLNWIWHLCVNCELFELRLWHFVMLLLVYLKL